MYIKEGGSIGFSVFIIECWKKETERRISRDVWVSGMSDWEESAATSGTENSWEETG
jgi:hypothetical protein